VKLSEVRIGDLVVLVRDPWVATDPTPDVPMVTGIYLGKVVSKWSGTDLKWWKVSLLTCDGRVEKVISDDHSIDVVSRG
jgi:hypothetical protein